MTGFEQDSFFDLTPWGQTGLALISLVMGLGMLWLAWIVGRSVAWALWVCVLFWLFLWLSPQVYYTYYLTLFEFLEQQIVVTWPPIGPEAFLYGVAGEYGSTLRGIGQGVMFWGMMALAGFRRWRLRS